MRDLRVAGPLGVTAISNSPADAQTRFERLETSLVSPLLPSPSRS